MKDNLPAESRASPGIDSIEHPLRSPFLDIALTSVEFCTSKQPLRRTVAVPTYKELTDQRAVLNARIEEARRAEGDGTLAAVRQTIADFGFTANDLFVGRRRANARQLSTAVPRFRDPDSGQTWSGRGPCSQWLENKDPELFRIKE
jgi:DNA-binding protein H-NS